MSWGHAIGTDLVHWKQLPVAISEYNSVMIFSGSAVVDRQNTSGFCDGPSESDHSCLVAIYTGYNGTIQNQNVAYSNDRGRTWTRYSHNPVIDLNMQDFRDPKVFWYETDRKWVMVTVLSALHKVRLFSSTDLKHWDPLSDFGPAGEVGGAWECPDLFQLPVENESGQSRWVLSVNVNPGGVAGGSGNQYFVGHFDGKTFVDANPGNEVFWADYGKDFYASTSFSDIPPADDRRIWMGWFGNWEYAARVPTFPWRGLQSIPRVLKLKRVPQGMSLVQEPIAELKSLRRQHLSIEKQSTLLANRILQSKKMIGNTIEIEVSIQPNKAESFGLEVRRGPSELTRIGIDSMKSELFVDRTHSGITNFDPGFPGRQTAPLNVSQAEAVELHIFVDRCTVEVFANHGEMVISDLIFPSPASEGLQFYSDGGEVRILRLDVWKLGSAWAK